MHYIASEWVGFNFPPVTILGHFRDDITRIMAGIASDVCWRCIYLRCTEAFRVLELFQDDTIYKFTYLLTLQTDMTVMDAQQTPGSKRKLLTLFKI